MFKIANIRAGFATNSSSSHSIVILPKGKEGSVHEVEPNGWGDGLEYGWDRFILTTPRSKMEYLATQLAMAIEHHIPDIYARAALINDITGVDLAEYIGKDPFGYRDGDYLNASVDHQSYWSIRGFNYEDPDTVQFFKDLAAKIRQDDVVILGGNDNENWRPPVPKGTKPFEVFTKGLDGDSRHRIIRKDQDYYTIFDKRTGTKIRFSIKDDAAKYTKANTPELVDLKITNYCPFGCSWCYMSSTKKGVHASLDEIKKHVDRLAELKVMEIAIGGGEPTMHPEFVQILEYINTKGMVANFTTFSVAWLKDERIVEAVRKYASAIGVSVHNRKDLDKVKKINLGVNETDYFAYFSDSDVRIMAQHVFGGTEPGETAQLLMETWEASIPLLLLGYKKTGFGADVEPHDMSSVIELLTFAATGNKYHANMEFLAIDTAFIKRFKPLLKKLKISPVLLSSPEGKFSMYIDAVTNKMAASSYDSPGKMVIVPESKEEFLKIWGKY